MKTAGRKPLGVRVPRPPLFLFCFRPIIQSGEVAEPAEGTGLLNLRRGNSTEGSNPSLSANQNHGYFLDDLSTLFPWFFVTVLKGINT